MLKVGSIFCGCGGADLGILGGFSFLGKYYSKLPFETVFAIDNDPKAIETYNRNFEKKGRTVDIRNFRKQIPDIDLLVGGFPCQSFSTVNPTKNPFDERAKLYLEMSRLLETKKPLAFIAENVKGLMVLKNGRILNDIKKEFESKGYTVTHALLNAVSFGVPQKRQRLFIIGLRNDLNKTFDFAKSLSVEEQDVVPLRRVIPRLKISKKRYYFSDKAVLGMKRAKNNMKRGLYQNLEEPCLTITSHLAKASLNSRDPVLLVDKNREIYRRFTPREAASIQSFPDTFEFIGSDQTAYKQIGNAIPPVLMWHVAKAVSGYLLENKILLSCKE